VILISNGAGIGPFKGFLEEKEALKSLGVIGDITLFFGCKKEDSDFLYKSEIENYRETRILTSFFPAFSRQNQVKFFFKNVINTGIKILCSRLSKKRKKINFVVIL
jgi:sulfite reductase alpha subunit-like flavoprotein